MIMTLKEVLNDQRGQGLVEYGLIISFIILVAIGTLQLFGIEVKNLYYYIDTKTSEVM